MLDTFICTLGHTERLSDSQNIDTPLKVKYCGILMTVLPCILMGVLFIVTLSITIHISLEYILFPVIAGAIVIIFLSVIINKLILRRNYPKKWF